jgi:hypothetical protein
MIRSYTDYAQRGHIYFQTPSLRREAFDFLGDRLDKLVRDHKADGAASILSIPRQFMEKKTGLIVRHMDDGLQREAEAFFVRNVESLLKLCALARNSWERFHTLYLIARFLPRLEEKAKGIKSSHLIQGYLKDIKGKENKGCFALAVKGLYRWDGKDVLQDWNRVPDLIKAIQDEMSEDETRPYEPLLRHAKMIFEKLRDKKGQKQEDILFLLFTSATLTAVRLRLLQEHGKDLLHAIRSQRQIELLESLNQNYALLFPEDGDDIGAVKTFISNRLGKAWTYEDRDRGLGNRATVMMDSGQDLFQSRISSEGASFSKKDAGIIRSLSRTGPSSS